MPKLKEVMSAAEFSLENNTRFPYYATPKIDGIRFYIQDGVVWSRSNKPIPNCWIQQLLPLYLPSGVDGELSYGEHNDPLHFQNTTSCVMSNANPIDDLRVYIFDYLQPTPVANPTETSDIGCCVGLQDFGEADLGYAHRIAYIHKWFNANKQLFIAGELVNRFADCPASDLIVEGKRGQLLEPGSSYKSRTLLQKVHANTVILTPTAIRKTEDVSRYLNLCLSQGYEGIMLRKPNGGYKFGRCTPSQEWLMKYKPFTDSEAIIIGFEELMHNDNPAVTSEVGRTKRSHCQAGKRAAGMLGAFLVQDPTSGANFSIGNGVGLTEALRRQVWNDRQTFFGKLIKYSYLSIGTKPGGLPRMPKFLGFRDSIDLSPNS